MRGIALVTVLAFACASARPPAQASPAGPLPAPPPPLRVALAQPQLELWMEGTKAIDPQESSASLQQSRNALSRAVANRGLEAESADQLLVVRERGIARTGERKTAQVISIVTVVVIIAVIIVAIALGSRSDSHQGTPVHTAVPASSSAVPGPWRGPAFRPRYYPPPPPIGVAVGFSVFVPPPGPSEPIQWVEPTDAWLASRGWLDGDATELTLELVDARSNAVVWHRTVRSSVDPRDAAAVTLLLDQALADQPFGRRTGPLPEPAEAARAQPQAPASAPSALEAAPSAPSSGPTGQDAAAPPAAPSTPEAVPPPPPSSQASPPPLSR